MTRAMRRRRCPFYCLALTTMMIGVGCDGDEPRTPDAPDAGQPAPPAGCETVCYDIGEGLVTDGNALAVDFGSEASTVAEGSDPRFADLAAEISALSVQVQELRKRDPLPVGMIMPLAGKELPPDWLPCDGRPLNRLTHPELFAVIGTHFGDGDGANSFNVPDLRGRAPIGAGQGNGLTERVLGDTVGSEQHKLTVAEMPSHTHAEHPGTGTVWLDRWSGGGSWPNERDGNTLDQTTGSTGGNQPHNIMQPSLAVQFVIKVR